MLVKFPDDDKLYRLNKGVHNYVKLVKTRKPNICVYCKREIRKGELSIVFQHQEGYPYMEYVRDYYCSECYELYYDK